mmetsp:Transcript_25348/g.22463  ORF Transcript_25348/g.22463 Transcript_25348/m.22463 type:complete len:83 (-) Transcript_25348:32-280(-)
MSERTISSKFSKRSLKTDTSYKANINSNQMFTYELYKPETTIEVLVEKSSQISKPNIKRRTREERRTQKLRALGCREIRKYS